jgi:hypothetical protein
LLFGGIAVLLFWPADEYIKPDRERVRDGASSQREDKGSPFGEDRQAHGLQACQRRWGENQLPKVVQGVTSSTRSPSDFVWPGFAPRAALQRTAAGTRFLLI